MPVGQIDNGSTTPLSRRSLWRLVGTAQRGSRSGQVRRPGPNVRRGPPLTKSWQIIYPRLSATPSILSPTGRQNAVAGLEFKSWLLPGEGLSKLHCPVPRSTPHCSGFHRRLEQREDPRARRRVRHVREIRAPAIGRSDQTNEISPVCPIKRSAPSTCPGTVHHCANPSNSAVMSHANLPDSPFGPYDNGRARVGNPTL